MKRLITTTKFMFMIWISLVVLLIEVFAGLFISFYEVFTKRAYTELGWFVHYCKRLNTYYYDNKQNIL